MDNNCIGMLLKDYDPKKVRYPVYVSIKENGLRGTRFSVGNWVNPRNSKPHHGLDFNDVELVKVKTVLEGELTVLGDMDFDTASGIIRSHNTDDRIVFNVFDLPDLPAKLKQRVKIMESSKFLNNLERTRVIMHHLVKNEEQLDKFYRWALAEGHEGIVIKDPESYYEQGKKSGAWMKRCPLLRTEIEIIGTYEGKGKMQGMLGGLVGIVEGPQGPRTVRVGGGSKETAKWTNKVRTEMWANRYDYHGKFATVVFKSWTAKGSLQQPRYEGLTEISEHGKANS